ncbi:DUF4105 domain-containing protein [Helicobacter jaachi]|nr:DUF4105 domain-containing protein [Helicobacter jaachi]
MACVFAQDIQENIHYAALDSIKANSTAPDSNALDSHALDSINTESADSPNVSPTQADSITPAQMQAIEHLLQQARELHLADTKEWKDLLHIDKNTSEIISPYFFLTPHFADSKHLAQDELEASIRAFYQPVSEIVVPQAIIDKRKVVIEEYKKYDIKLPTRSIEPQDYHALCRFPARFAYLSKHLDFTHLPKLDCAEFKAMLNYIAPTKASMIFPSAHINSPASMFGHTFLLLDSVFQSRLLAFAINYQADADQSQENAFIFAFKGLFGFYTGSYDILPYYNKIKEYSNTEARDMWEYELNFNRDEIMQLYKHMWELSDGFSSYYFFHRNCSYNVLWLLEVARPSLKLRHEFIYQVNPPETIFALQRANLITNFTYRPSKRTKLYAYEKLMSFKEVSMAKKLANTALDSVQMAQMLDNPAFNTQSKQYILESAMELSEYRFIKGKLEKDTYTHIAHELASMRSKLGASTPVPIKEPANILEGNRSLRITPLVLNNAQGTHPALDFRITFHDITDNDIGYLKGSQIEFMRALGFYDTSTHDFKGAKIYELNILSIASIAPMGKFFKPFSYRLETGFNRTFNDTSLHYFAAFGGGLSLDFGDIAYAYYMLEPTFFVNMHKGDFALSSVLGIVASNNARLKFTAEYKFRAYSPTHFNHLLDTTFSINLKQNLALLVRVNLLNNNVRASDLHPTSMLGIRLYF